MTPVQISTTHVYELTYDTGSNFNDPCLRLIDFCSAHRNLVKKSPPQSARLHEIVNFVISRASWLFTFTIGKNTSRNSTIKVSFSLYFFVYNLSQNTVNTYLNYLSCKFVNFFEAYRSENLNFPV